MNKADYNRVRSTVKRLKTFIERVKEKDDTFHNPISELEEELEYLHSLFPCLDYNTDGKLSLELSSSIANFYGENSKLLRFVGGVDKGDHIEVTMVAIRPGVLIGYAGSLYDQLNEVLNKEFGKRVHIHLKEEMWDYRSFLMLEDY